LARINPDNELAIIDSDDDSGWQTAAKLEAFPGTGRVEKFTVNRNDATRGNVAVLVSKQPIPLRDADAADSVDATAQTPGWERFRLAAGAWIIDTADLSANFDPILSVFDAKTGKLLARNDDADVHTVASRVHIKLREPSELVMRVESADKGGGSTRLQIRADKEVTHPVKHLRHSRAVQSSPSISKT
jgi:hypothetical protein